MTPSAAAPAHFATLATMAEHRPRSEQGQSPRGCARLPNPRAPGFIGPTAALKAPAGKLRSDAM
jgi:hypothetical protein